jgi:hypothetical protein
MPGRLSFQANAEATAGFSRHTGSRPITAVMDTNRRDVREPIATVPVEPHPVPAYRRCAVAAIACIVTAAILSGCGAQRDTRTVSRTVTSTTTPSAEGSLSRLTASDRRAIIKAITTVFVALRHRDYGTVCRSYMPDLAVSVIVAARKVTGQTPRTCAQGLDAILNAVPSASRALSHLGLPQISHMSLHGNTVNVTYSSKTLGGLTAHSTVQVIHAFDTWKLGTATSLNFAGG